MNKKENYFDIANNLLDEDYKINFKGDMGIEHAKAVCDKMITNWANGDGIKQSIREFDSELSDSDIELIIKDFQKSILPKLLDCLYKIK